MSRDPNHNELVDNNNLYEHGLLMSPRITHDAKHDNIRFEKLGFKVSKLMGHTKYVRDEHPEYWDYPHSEDVIMFIINGNQGSHEQPPLIVNQIEKYLNKVTESQKTQKKDKRFRDADQKTYYRVEAYEWNFLR